MKERTATPDDAGVRLDLWLVRHADAGSRSRATAWIARGKVFLNGAEAGLEDAAHRMTAGDRVSIWIDRPGSARPADRAIADARPRLSILHEDDVVVVIDKAVGLLVEPLPNGDARQATVLDLLADHYRHLLRAHVHVVHRIDRDTSGLVLFARSAAARDHLKDQFERRTPDRLYQAVVLGAVEEDSALWEDSLTWDKTALRQRRAHLRDVGARDAVARMRVVERFVGATLIEVALVTGKRNQIRVQAALRGHPLLGEHQYRFGAPPEPARLPRIDRQALHAWRLAFTHPGTKERMTCTSPLPGDLVRLLRNLRRTS